MAKDGAYLEAERRIERTRQAGDTELYLHAMGLTELPETIGSLTQLQVLDLYQNQLTTLPETIASLTGLQELNLRANEFTNLPEALAALVCKPLTYAPMNLQPCQKRSMPSLS